MGVVEGDESALEPVVVAVLQRAEGVAALGGVRVPTKWAAGAARREAAGEPRVGVVRRRMVCVSLEVAVASSQPGAEDPSSTPWKMMTVVLGPPAQSSSASWRWKGGMSEC
jgi:hypothetical protein